MADARVRLGVDIGGTFTDVVLEHGSVLFSTKVLTAYAAPEDAIIEGICQVCAKANILPSTIDQIIHGTTLATNALIERRGAKTAFITTKGFRDVIEMRTESRFEQYDLNLVLPAPLLPRNRRYVINERMDASGAVVIPLMFKEIKALAQELASASYESIAIGLLHAYANNAHERLIAQVLAESLPRTMVSLSSEVSPQMREYERFNTTIANAYIKPLMKSYLDRLRQRLASEGVKCPVFLMHSGGGIMSLESAADFPVRLVESGPAGGAIFAAHIAARHGIHKALSFDMGGTTAKICLIKNQAPKTARVFEVARTYRFKKGSGMPISIPVIDMVEIGAGGGSLAHVDGMNQIRVGPQSAGSEPGPACYGLGGKHPAVTDADLILGKLDPNHFAGGTIQLYPEYARATLGKDIGTRLNMNATELAWGVAEVVDENMANAARVHAVENGEDLSEYTMIAFGGAAPLHAARLCEKLGIARCLVPQGAGVGSAIGFLRAPFSFEATRSVFMRIAALDAVRVKALFQEMQEEATQFVRSCHNSAQILKDHKVYMRYAGQGWEIPIALSAEQAKTPDAKTYLALFERDYANLFGRTVAGLEVEITGWSVNAYTTDTTYTDKSHTKPAATAEKPSKTPRRLKQAGQAKNRTPPDTRSLFDPGIGQTLSALVLERIRLQPGQTVQGPAIVTENETTVVVPTSRYVLVSSDGTLDMRAPINAATNTTARVPRASMPSADNTNASAVAYQVMWNRMLSVVEEQAQALVRTAFSTSVREAGDLSAASYNQAGEMLAQAVTGTPGHVNAMAAAVAHFIRHISYVNMFEGDIYITNNPWQGTGHKHDITVVTPSFYQGALTGFLACTAHVTDIGGRGFGADANDVYEEGLHIPIMKLAERGKIDNTLVAMIRANVREPDQIIGDIYALATCNEVGHKRLLSMMQEFALSDLNGISDFILSSSRKAALDKIKALPTGVATGHMRIDGYTKAIDLNVCLSIEANRILCDWDGTSGLDKKGINVPLIYTKAYTCYALKCAIAPEVPNNAASLAPFEVIAPEHSIVNARYPAPVALRHVIGHMIPDTVYDALDKLLPDMVPAEGAGCLCNFQVSLRPRTDAPAPAATVRAEVLTFNSGGAGARPSLDGMSTTAFPSGVMTMPVEATEQVGPVIIWRKELRPDSGGAGRYRGGLGQYMEVGACAGYEFDIQAMLDRAQYPARGRHGGQNGAPTQIQQDDGTAMRGKGKQFVPHGRRVCMAFPGGAGYGDPLQRETAAIYRDLALGYITPEFAARHYCISQADIAAILRRAEQGETFP